MEKEKTNLTFKPRGVIEDADGRVAGFWIRHRKGHRNSYLFAKPIKKTRKYRIERKTITVDGKVFRDVPVKVYPRANNLTHWGKYSD